MVTICVGQVGVCASGHYFCWPGRSWCQWSLFLSTRYELVSVVTISVGQVGVGASGHYFLALLTRVKGRVQGLGCFSTRFPLKFAENNDVGEIVI